MLPSLRVLLTSTTLLALAGAAAAQPFYTTFGTGCSNSGVPPTIGVTGDPVSGQTFSIDVSSAPASAPASLAFGGSNQVWNGLPLPFDLTPLGFAGCSLLVSLDLTLPAHTDPTGTGHVSVKVPTSATLIGGTFYNQWFVLDTGLKLALSDGGCGTVGDLPPISLVSVSPPSGPVGTTVTIHARDLGRTNPDDLCVRVMDPSGDTSLLRATSIAQDPMTGDDVITATLVTAAEVPMPAPSSVGIMRGSGGQPTLASTPSLDVSSAWGWQGSPLPGSSAAGGQFTAVPTPTVAVTNFQLTPVGFTTTLPADPFGNGGTYPGGQAITIEIHVKIGGRWIDIVITLGTSTAALAQSVTSEVGTVLQDALDQTLGKGQMTVSTNGLSLDVSPAGSASQPTAVVGHVILP